jgi:hypothetical protein
MVKSSDDKSSDKKPDDKAFDPHALSAAVAGFLACQVLTCRFLMQEGVIDGDKFITFLENAMAEMAPGLEDQRALFGLQQLINGLRGHGKPPVPTQ